MSVTVTQKGTDGWIGQSIRIHLEKRVFTCELGQAILDNNGQKTFDCSPGNFAQDLVQHGLKHFFAVGPHTP